MRVLNTVAASQTTRAMKMPHFQLIKRRTVQCQPVSCDAFGLNRLRAIKGPNLVAQHRIVS